jgi:predicted CXXCH cytochrome family protein
MIKSGSGIAAFTFLIFLAFLVISGCVEADIYTPDNAKNVSEQLEKTDIQTNANIEKTTALLRRVAYNPSIGDDDGPVFQQKDGNSSDQPIVVAARAQSADLKSLKITEETSCVTGSCHGNMGKEKFVHGPVAVGQCVFCHNIVDNKHKFTLLDEGKELCYNCHDSKEEGKHIHSPVEEGMCTSCHDPHQSPNQYQLLGSPISEVCNTCHEDKTAGEYVHGPVAMGECTMCHDPHASPNAFQLQAEGNELCFMCHTPKQEDFETRKFKHPPAEESCVTCHNPHSSPNPFWLEEAMPDLCFQCHVDIDELVAGSKVVHGALNQDNKCANCHDPHTADIPKQLRAETMDLCLNCHDKPIASGGKTLSNMKVLLETRKDWHGPIRQKDCTACHNPHASNNFRILKEYFPPVFYAPFKVKNYALCFRCHEPTMVLDKYTTTLTGFRNGNRNLHYLHVNKNPKGRTCRACHQPHASNKPKHIREGVPFGRWELPINYAKSETGGRCSPGCHSTKRYDRLNQVENRK